MEDKLFWKRVKELMATQNVLQKDMADAVGISIGSFKNWLCRDILPNCEQSVRIAQKLNTTVEYLVTGNSGENKLSSDDIELLQLYHSIPSKFRHIALNMIKEIKQIDNKD